MLMIFISICRSSVDRYKLWPERWPGPHVSLRDRSQVPERRHWHRLPAHHHHLHPFGTGRIFSALWYSFFGTGFWLREEFEVAGFFVFSHIRMMGYFRLG